MCDYSPHDCNNTAHWYVTSPDGRTRHVCSDHRDARIHDGWTLTDNLQNKVQAATEAKQGR